MQERAAAVAEVIRDALLTTWPGRFEPETIVDGVSLGEDGLGLDSIDLVEVLLVCEERFGVSILTDDGALDGWPFTLGRLAEHVARA